jgi:hypothetical protein
MQEVADSDVFCVNDKFTSKFVKVCVGLATEQLVKSCAAAMANLEAHGSHHCECSLQVKISTVAASREGENEKAETRHKV